MTHLVKAILCLCLVVNLAFATGVSVFGSCGDCGGRVGDTGAACCECCKQTPERHGHRLTRGQCECCMKAPAAPTPAPGQDEKPNHDGGARRFSAAALDCSPQTTLVVAAERGAPSVMWDIGPPRSLRAARAVRLLI